MLKKHMAACLVVTAFAAAPAFAQNPSAPTDRPTATGSGSTASGSPAMQPGASGMGATGTTGTTGASSSMGGSSMGQSGASAMNQSSGAKGQFMTQMQPNQIMASDLIGTRVVSANNESIGDINDVILDRNGQVMAAVVGVGGFLGIGEKDVAVPFNSLEFANSQQAQAMDRGGNGNNVTTTGSTGSSETTSGTTGSSMGKAANNAGITGNSAASNQPERVVLRMTKAELQAAPAFNAKANSGASNTGSGATGGRSGTPAPQQ